MFTINQNLIDDFADKINEKEKKSNKVTSLSSESTDTEYPSAKAVHDNISSATTAINNRITNLNEGNINIAGAPYTQLGGTTATSLATLLHNIDNNFGDILFCAYNVGGTADAFTISGTGGFGNLTSNHPFILLAYNNVADSNAGATLTINNTMNPVVIANSRRGGTASCAWKQGEWGIFFIYNGSAQLLGSFSDTEYYQGMEFVTSTNTQNSDTSLTGVTHKLNNLKDGTIFFYQLPNLRFTSESTTFVLTLRNNISISGALKENNVNQSLNQLSPNDILILQYSANPLAYNIIGKIKANTFTEKKDAALQLLCNAILPYRIFTVHTVKKEDKRTTYLLTYDGVPYAANEILYVYVPTYEFTRNTKPILSWENGNMPSGSGMYIYPINSGTALYENDLNGYYLKIQYRNYRWELLEKTNNIVEATTEHAGLLSASDKIKLNNLHTVATSGSYNDLSNKPTIPTATSDLTNDSGFLTSHQSLDSKTVTVEEQSQAETGFTKTYIIKQGGVQVGNKINIPKDFLVKSASVKTVSTANNPIQGYVAGDKYLDFVVNSKDNTATDEHLYVLVSELVDTEIDWANVQNKPTFFDGNYNSLTNKPTIPTDVSDLTDTTNKQFTPKSHTHTIDLNSFNFYDADNWRTIDGNAPTTTSDSVQANAVSHHILNKEFLKSKHYTLTFEFNIGSNRGGFYLFGDKDCNMLFEITTDIGNTCTLQHDSNGNTTELYAGTKNHFTSGWHDIKVIRKGDTAIVYIDDELYYTFNNIGNATNIFGLLKWSSGSATIKNIDVSLDITELPIEDYIKKDSLKTIEGVNLVGNEDIAIDVSYSSSNILFEDACSSASGLSNYESSVRVRGSSSTMTMEYDSTENAYKVYGSGNYHCYMPITALNGKTQYKLSADVKGQAIKYNMIGFFIDNCADTTSYGLSVGLDIGKTNNVNQRLWSRLFRVSSDGTEYQVNLTNNPLSADKYYNLRLEVDGNSYTWSLYDGTTKIAENNVTYTIDNKKVGIFLYCETGTTNSACYIKNIKAKTLDNVIFEDKGVTGDYNSDYTDVQSGITTTVGATGTTLQASGSGDKYRRANALVSGDFEMKYTCTSATNIYGSIAFLSSSNSKFFYVEQEDTNDVYINTTAYPIGETITFPFTMTIRRVDDKLTVWYNDIQVATNVTVSDSDGYWAWKLYGNDGRQQTFKDFTIIEYNAGGSENTIYLGDDIMTMINTALKHIIINWEDYE